MDTLYHVSVVDSRTHFIAVLHLQFRGASQLDHSLALT